LNLVDILRRIDLDRFDIVVVSSLDPATVARPAGHGIEFRPNHYDRRRRARTTLKLVTTLVGLRRRTELVYANDVRAAVLGAFARLLGGPPVVWHVHDLGPWPRWLPRLARCSGFRRYIAISHAVAGRLATAGFPQNAVDVVHNGVDVDDFTPERDGSSFRRQVGCPPESVLVGIVGRILDWKGQDVFVEAAARVRSRADRVHFVIVGDIPPDEPYRTRALPFKQRVLEMVRAQGLTECLHFMGERLDVPDVMAGLDICVLASDAEPFGRVLIEAMAAGKPVVATRAGGVPEIVVDGVTGYLIPPRDPAALAQKLLGLVADQTLRARLGLQGRQVATECFSVDRFVHGIESVLFGACRA
jgi:glycosyltransferase involved in cell wall biosynthesis